MENENRSTVDFLNNIDVQADVFKEEAPSQKEADVEDAVDEKPLPFHKDPKVQRYIQREIENRVKDFAPSAETQFRKEVREEINLPDSFVKLVGNDTEEKKQVLKDLSNYFGTLKGEARQEFLEELQQQEQQQVAADNAALDELNAGFETIEEDYGVDLSSNSKVRSAFVEHLRKVSHKDANGEVDMFADIPAAWEDFQERQKPQSASRAKELASRGMTRSSDTTGAVPKGRSWKDVDRFFDQLKSNN